MRKLMLFFLMLQCFHEGWLFWGLTCFYVVFLTEFKD